MWLHAIGDAIRAWLLLIPLPLVRLAFALLPLALLIWVWLLPRDAVERPGESETRDRAAQQLKWAATVALGLQVVVYLMEFAAG